MPQQRTFAIHTTFIAKENILFMEEWIDYHIQLGFGKFYLYDNSKCQRPGEWDRLHSGGKHNIVPGKVSKHGFKYDEEVKMNQEELEEHLWRLTDRYLGNIILTEWSPKDEETGLITYGQLEAHSHCLSRLKKDRVDWCAFIDIDEFIVLGRFKGGRFNDRRFDDIGSYIDAVTSASSGPGDDEAVNNIRMSQNRFMKAWARLDELVTDADRGIPNKLGRAAKNLFKVDKTDSLNVHDWYGEGKQRVPVHDEICFNHYNHLDIPPETPVLNNISPALKKHLKRNSPDYFRTRLPGGRKYRHSMEGRFIRLDSLPLKPLKAGAKRILHYVAQFSVPSQTFIYDLIQRLDTDTDHDNIVLCRQRLLIAERPYDKVLNLPWDIMPREEVSAIYRRLLERCEIDMVVVHFAAVADALRVLEEAAGLSLPMLVMTHGYDVFELRQAKAGRVAKRIRERTDYVINCLARRDDVRFTAVSAYLAGELAAAGVAADRIALVPNTVHGRFIGHRKVGDYYRPDGGRPLRLLNIGRLMDWKGHRFLLDAVARFRRECGEAELTIVYGNAGTELEALQKQAIRLGINESVVFEPFIDFAADPAYISRFDLYIHCSTYTEGPVRKSESFGVGVLEAIAAGLPVISTDAGGTPQVVGGRTPHARTIPHGDADALFQALAEMVAAPETFTDNIDYARDRLNTFSPQRQIEAMQRLIQLLTES